MFFRAEVLFVCTGVYCITCYQNELVLLHLSVTSRSGTFPAVTLGITLFFLVWLLRNGQ